MAAEEKLSFISVNDTLPPELINAAATYGGMTYVPYWLFTNYNLGIYYVFFSSSNTAYLYSADRQLFFSLSDGKTFDEDDYQYSVSAIVRGGTVYLPLGFVCSYFGGFSYANIGSNEYGSVIRITTGGETLTNDEFMRAAKSAMRTYYASYNRSTDVTPTAEPGAQPTNEPTHEGELVRLGLRGLPGADTLDLLRKFGMRACFFLTAEEVRGSADLVRRLACEGHALGIYCPNGAAEEFEETAALLREAARVRAVLTLTPDGTAPEIGAAAYSRTQGTLADDISAAELYSVTAALDSGSSGAALLFPCGEGCEKVIGALLYYLHEGGFTVIEPRETT